MEEKLRIKKFDRFLDNNEIVKYGDQLTVCTCYDRTKGEKLTSDIITEFLEEFAYSKYHASLQIAYVIPNHFDISVPITMKERLGWYCEQDSLGNHFIKVRFTMTDEQHRQQIETFRNFGVDLNILQLGDNDVLDIGEINPECIFKFTISKNAIWCIRSEPIKIYNDDDKIPPEDGNLISLTMEKYPDIQNRTFSPNQAGMICLSIVTGMTIFSEEHLARAQIKEEVIDEGHVTILTDDDCKLPDFSVEELYTDNIPEDQKEEREQRLKEIQKEVSLAQRRKSTWEKIFSCPNPFIQEMLNTWITTLEKPQNDNQMQVYLRDFEKWLIEKNSHEKFMSILKAETTDQNPNLVQNIDFSNLVITDEHREVYNKKIIPLTKIFSQKMADIGKEMGIEANCAQVPVEYSERIQQIPELIEYERLAWFLALNIAFANGLLKKADGTLYAKEELEGKSFEEFPILKHIIMKLSDMMEC